MPGRGRAIAAVAALVAIGIAVVIFVFGEMSDSRGVMKPAEPPFTPPPSPPAPPPSQPSSPPIEAPAALPPADPIPPPPKTPTPDADPAPEPDTPGEPGIEPARLILRLLKPVERKEGVIAISVVDLFGQGVPGALVVVRQGSELLWRERANRAGEAWFVPYEEEAGPFRIDAIARGYVAATAPAVAPGATVQIVLPLQPAVIGEVRSPAKGEGVVRLFTADGVLTTRIEADGSFAFYELEEGPVTVQAEVPPYGVDAEALVLRAGEQARVRLRIRERDPARLEGEIHGWPGKGDVRINGAPVDVTATGRFRFEQGVYGVNEILIDAPEKALLRERFEVKPGLVARPSFRLYKESTVKGRVRSARTQRPLAGAEVRIGVDYGNPRNERVLHFPIERVPVLRTDSEGRFEIGRLDARLLYLVSVVAQGYGHGLADVIPNGGFAALELPEGPFLFGRLRGLGGVPRDAIVTARPLGAPPTRLFFNVPDWDLSTSGRDADGYYGLSGLLPGLYHVRVQAPDFGSLETVVELFAEQRARLDLRLRRGAEVDEEAWELLERLPPSFEEEGDPAPAPGSRTTLVIDAERPPDQAPFPSLRIEFFYGEDEIRAPEERSGPRFELHGLPEGSWRALLLHSSMRQPVVREGIVLRRGEIVVAQVGSD
ncbi:MAG: hypothetical protein ACT4PV_09950 [Planctomycetaceae bacterium]